MTRDKKPTFPLEIAAHMARVSEMLIAAQSEVNRTVRPDWEKANFPFFRAAHTEIGEALGYTSWEWWKNLDQNFHDVFRKEEDIAEFHMELVDAFHFLISAFIVRNQGHEGELEHWAHARISSALFDQLARAHNKSHTEFWLNHFAEHGELGSKPIEGPEATLQRVEALQRACLDHDVKGALDLLVEVSEWTGLGLKGLVGRYFAKNTLNKFRAANGYKEKTYTKFWGDVGGEQKEDNFFLNRETLEYFKTVSLDEMIERLSNGVFQADLYAHLEAMYSRRLRAGHCDHETAQAVS